MLYDVFHQLPDGTWERIEEAAPYCCVRIYDNQPGYRVEPHYG